MLCDSKCSSDCPFWCLELGPDSSEVLGYFLYNKIYPVLFAPPQKNMPRWALGPSLHSFKNCFTIHRLLQFMRWFLNCKAANCTSKNDPYILLKPSFVIKHLSSWKPPNPSPPPQTNPFFVFPCSRTGKKCRWPYKCDVAPARSMEPGRPSCEKSLLQALSIEVMP